MTGFPRAGHIIIRGVPIWLFTDIPIADMNEVVKPIKHNRSDIINSF